MSEQGVKEEGREPFPEFKLEATDGSVIGANIANLESSR